MSLNAAQLIAGLGDGRSVEDLAAAAGVSIEEVQNLWRSIIRGKVPAASANLSGLVDGPVEIIRDRYGVPHVYAGSERDIFFGLGFAMAQDHLWMMDYMRRKATGYLAEILGPAYLEQDYTYRVLDFSTVCARNYERLSDRWRAVLDGMAGGINRAMARFGDNLPIEFDLLHYRPTPWSPVDILVGLRYQWWGLSGRLAQITSSTLLERALGDQLDAFSRPERGDRYIVPDGLNEANANGPAVPVRDLLHLGAEPHGSNNWVIGGSRTKSGKPLLANDPHYTYSHGHGHFYPCHLDGAGHAESGFVFIGTPGMMTGTNGQVAWGFTNSGTSIRDLYAEEFDPADPTRYRHGDRWERLSERTVEIAVKGQAPVTRIVQATHNGPIVNGIIPRVSENDPPLSLRWVGFETIDDVQALLEMNSATNWAEFRAALANWACSVTNFIYGDAAGNVGYQLSARIPLREVPTRGIRVANDPAHQWQGYIPFDGNPRMTNPPSGIVASANQRTVSPGYAWPLFGAYAGGTRQARILQVLSEKTDHDVADFRRMQYDSKSLIAEECVPRIVAALRRSGDPDLAKVAARLAAWDYRAPIESMGPALFESFMHEWTPVYAAATLPENPVVRAAAGPSAHRALLGEEVIAESRLDELIATAMRQALAILSEQVGSGPDAWTWGKLHSYSWPHPLGQRGHLGELLDGPRLATAGASNTINNVSPAFQHALAASSGPTYRLIADLANPSVVYVNSHCPTSGHPASPHYQDTVRDWASGNYQTLYRDRALIEVEAEGTTRISP